MLESTPTEQGQLNLSFETPKVVDWRAQVPSVSEITRKLRGHIENSFFDVWVKGEISNFRKPASGHSYFILKDAGAQLRSVMFRPALQKLKFELKDGMEILLHGRVTIYEARGDYQIVADTAEPVGVGALQLAFEQLKQKLHAEGLFDPKHKKRLPTLPRRIGVVTSSTGAAVRDVIKVLSRRYPNLHILVFPALVQGDKAGADIVRAIGLAEKWNERCPDRLIDVLIVGRGGGSLEDLWPFNEEVVARKIHACQIPIISAVGHEIDFTIADFVADLRAPTPSAAAEIVVPNKADLVVQIESYQTRLRTTFRKHIDQIRLHLTHLSERLVDPRQRLRELREKFTSASGKLLTAMKTRCLLARRRLEAQMQVLDSLSPLNVLHRGYSITRAKGGAILKAATDASIGNKIEITLGKGTLEATVEKVTD